MSRMCDRMMADGVKRYPLNGTRLDHKEVAGLFDGTTILNIDNVAQYLYAGTTQERWDTMQDFPDIAPPFERFWMEYNYPYQILTRSGLRTREKGPLQTVGFFFEGRAIHDKDMGDIKENTAYFLRSFLDAPPVAKVVNQITTRMAELGETNIGSDKVHSTLDYGQRCVVEMMEAIGLLAGGRPGQHIDTERVLKGAKWAMYADLYMDLGYIIGPIMHWMCFITPDGQAMLHPLIMVFGDPDQMSADIGNEIWSALLALSFLHCKNVTMVNNVPALKLSRAFQKRRGRPLMNFKTLEIEPMKRILRREGQSETTGLKRALHVCRGHFADYSKHGLFGKVKGVFWREAHVRGSTSEGTVVKDYAVKAKA